MATYIEIRQLFNDSDLGNKVDVAVTIAANNLLAATPTAGELNWAADVFANPRAEGQKALMAVLAESNALTVDQIINATDAAIQTTVDAIVPSLVLAAV